MNVHEIFDKYKDKRESIYSVYLDLFEEVNNLRKQRDFAMSLVKFIDMEKETDDPTGTWFLVEKRIAETESKRLLNEETSNT